MSTGEDVPEHSASSLARLVVIPVPRKAKDIARGSAAWPSGTATGA